MRSCVVLALVLVVTGCAGGTNTRDSSELTQRQQAASLNAQLGSDYFRQGNWEQAKEKLDRALEQDPRNVQAQMVAGLLYDRLGEQGKAEAHLQRAVALDEKNPEVRNAYAVYLCRHRKFEAGEKHALQAATDPLYKTPEWALLNAGHCALGAGDIARAEKHFRRALEIQPRFAPALYEMANLEFQAKQFLLARAFFERHMSSAEVSAAALWLGVRIETALGNRSLAADYARRLKKDFTTSDETKALLEFERTAK
jgi:type IV pilus assembly protein PilF